MPSVNSEGIFLSLKLYTEKRKTKDNPKSIKAKKRPKKASAKCFSITNLSSIDPMKKNEHEKKINASIIKSKNILTVLKVVFVKYNNLNFCI